ADFGQEFDSPTCFLLADYGLVPLVDQRPVGRATENVNEGGPGFQLNAVVLVGSHALPEQRKLSRCAQVAEHRCGAAADTGVAVAEQRLLQTLENLLLLGFIQRFSLPYLAHGPNYVEANAGNWIVQPTSQGA